MWIERKLGDLALNTEFITKEMFNESDSSWLEMPLRKLTLQGDCMIPRFPNCAKVTDPHKGGVSIMWNGQVRFPLDMPVLVRIEAPVDPASLEACPDCKGTGEYKGFAVVESCGRCKGTGNV